MVVLGEAISQDLAFITFFLGNILGGFSPVLPWSFLFEGPTSLWVWARVEARGGSASIPPTQGLQRLRPPRIQCISVSSCLEVSRIE